MIIQKNIISGNVQLCHIYKGLYLAMAVLEEIMYPVYFKMLVSQGLILNSGPCFY